MALISRTRDSLATRWHSLSHRQQLWTMFICAIFFFSIIISLDSRIAGSDDTTFITQTAPYHTVIDWVTNRYQSWSGRIIGEGVVYVFSNLPLLFWQIVTVCMYALSSALLFCYYRLLTPVKQHVPMDRFALIASLILPYLLDKSVFAEGILWVTGGMVYYWSLVLMLLTLYAPTRNLLRREHTPWWLTLASFLSTIIVTLSSEQAGIALITCLMCICVALLYKKSAFRWQNLGLLSIAMISFFLSIKAPGNIIRLHSETATWLPDFYTAPLFGHINDALRWVLDALINHTGLVLILLWLCLAALLLMKKVRTHFDTILVIVLVTVSVFSLGRGLGVLQQWTQFRAIWHASVSVPSEMLLLGWGAVLIATPLVALRALSDRTTRLAVIVLTLSGIGTTVMMTLTPTMYASGWRSMLIPSMLLGIAAFLTSIHIWYDARQRQRYLICIVMIYSLSHYVLQLSRMIAQR